MACPTCENAMNMVDSEGKVFHCIRCGTVTVQGEFISVPKLVERCLRYERVLSDPKKEPVPIQVRNQWVTLGIAESIRIPAKLV